MNAYLCSNIRGPGISSAEVVPWFPHATREQPCAWALHLS